jgi:hypothetical protein
MVPSTTTGPVWKETVSPVSKLHTLCSFPTFAVLIASSGEKRSEL